jgi:hypothetical protein
VARDRLTWTKINTLHADLAAERDDRAKLAADA